jgi:3-keto-5-aminohexanoate cleavage enzyme
MSKFVNERQSDELILCVAPHPGDKEIDDFPMKINVPDEVIRSYNAGASIAHLHVRDDGGWQTTDTSLFRNQIEEIHAACSMTIEGSTGGTPAHTLEERSISINVSGIEMGSLNLGSVNMGGSVYQNPMSDIRYYAAALKERNVKPFLIVFDLSMFHNATRIRAEGLLEGTQVYNLVFDIPDTLPYSKKTLDIFLDQLPEDSVWFISRHHAHGSKDFLYALERGGCIRVGYEDGPFLSTGARARSNAELVEEVVRAAESVGRKVVDSRRAREILGIPALKKR